MSTATARLVLNTDRDTIRTDFGKMLARAGTASSFEDATRRDGVPRHVAREMGRKVVVVGVGDGEHPLGNGWWMTVDGEQVEVRLGRGEAV